MTSLEETPEGRTALDFATTNQISINLELPEEGFSYNSYTRTLFLGRLLTREEQEGYFILAMTVLSQPELNAADLSYDDYVAERINRQVLGWENAIEHHGQREVQQEDEQAGRIPPEALRTPRSPLPLQNEYEQAYHEGVNRARERHAQSRGDNPTLPEIISEDAEEQAGRAAARERLTDLLHQQEVGGHFYSLEYGLQWWARQQQHVPQPPSGDWLEALQPILASMPQGNLAMWIAQASHVQVLQTLPYYGESRFDQEQNTVYINRLDSATEQANTYIRLMLDPAGPPLPERLGEERQRRQDAYERQRGRLQQAREQRQSARFRQSEGTSRLPPWLRSTMLSQQPGYPTQRQQMAQWMQQRWLQQLERFPDLGPEERQHLTEEFAQLKEIQQMQPLLEAFRQREPQQQRVLLQYIPETQRLHLQTLLSLPPEQAEELIRFLHLPLAEQRTVIFDNPETFQHIPIEQQVRILQDTQVEQEEMPLATLQEEPQEQILQDTQVEQEEMPLEKLQEMLNAIQEEQWERMPQEMRDDTLQGEQQGQITREMQVEQEEMQDDTPQEEQQGQIPYNMQVEQEEMLLATLPQEQRIELQVRRVLQLPREQQRTWLLDGRPSRQVLQHIPMDRQLDILDGLERYHRVTLIDTLAPEQQGQLRTQLDIRALLHSLPHFQEMTQEQQELAERIARLCPEFLYYMEPAQQTRIMQVIYPLLQTNEMMESTVEQQNVTLQELFAALQRPEIASMTQEQQISVMPLILRYERRLRETIYHLTR